MITITLTDDEAKAVAAFFGYGATRGNHSVEGLGPPPGPLTPYVAPMARVVGKLYDAKCGSLPPMPSAPPAPTPED
jgi:hypothetical protein